MYSWSMGVVQRPGDWLLIFYIWACLKKRPSSYAVGAIGLPSAATLLIVKPRALGYLLEIT